MPRGPEPSWEMKRRIIDFAAKEGQDNLSVIQRDLDRIIGKDELVEGESTPDPRTIKRVIDEFQRFDQELVVREFPPYVWKMRHDFEEIKARSENEQRVVHVEPKAFLPLLHQWREQAQFWSLDEFLRRYWLRGLRREVQHRVSPQRDAQIYIAAKRHHVHASPALDRVFLQVEQEALFHRLRQCYPVDPAWEAQGSWGRAYAAYLDASASWCGDVQDYFEALVALILVDELRQEGREVASTKEPLEQLKKKDANWLVFLELASLVGSCDLLTLGIAELSPDPPWFLHLSTLKTLRDEAVEQSAQLPGDFGLRQDDIGGMGRFFWEHLTEVKENTRALLHKLQTLQAAHDDLHGKLTALEFRLYDVTESQMP